VGSPGLQRHLTKSIGKRHWRSLHKAFPPVLLDIFALCLEPVPTEDRVDLQSSYYISSTSLILIDIADNGAATMSKPTHDIDVLPGDETIENYEKKHDHLNDAQAKNAVGYQEYIEGLDLEVSDREVP
jgi:hypothetical protein